MDIFEFAIEKEQLAKKYYLELKEKTDNTGLQNIFELLASEEDKHVHIIEQMRNNQEHEVAQSSVLSDAKKVFEKMRTAAEKFNVDVSEKELYQKARQIEANARDYYKEKAGEAKEEWHRKVFEKLAGEEEKHYRLMDSFCEMVARPERWLEDAEFYHLEDY